MALLSMLVDAIATVDISSGERVRTTNTIFHRISILFPLRFGRRIADGRNIFFLSFPFSRRRHPSFDPMHSTDSSKRRQKWLDAGVSIEASHEINPRRWHYSSSFSSLRRHRRRRRRVKVNTFKASFTLDCLFCANKFYSDIRTVAKLNEANEQQWLQGERSSDEKEEEREKNKLFGRENSF